MAKLTPCALTVAAVASGLLWSVPGNAATDNLAALKAELEALKSEYGSRVQALEERIKALETEANARAAAQPSVSAPVAAAPPVSPAPAAPPAFEPGLPISRALRETIHLTVSTFSGQVHVRSN